MMFDYARHIETHNGGVLSKESAALAYLMVCMCKSYSHSEQKNLEKIVFFLSFFYLKNIFIYKISNLRILKNDQK